MKIVIFLVALHNKPNFDLSSCYEFLPSIYKGFEIDVLRGVNLKTAIVFVALYKGISFFTHYTYYICRKVNNQRALHTFPSYYTQHTLALQVLHALLSHYSF